MTKFVLLVFGFLAVAFYEMSGGADFSATTARLAAMEARKGESVGAVTPLDTASQADLVARSSLNLVSFSDVAAENPAVAKDDPELRARAIPAAAVASGTASSAASEGSETMQEATALPGSTGTVSAARPTETLGIVAARGAAPAVPAPSLLDQRAVPENATRAIRFEGRTSRASSQDVTTQPLQTTTQSILTPQQQIRRVNGDLVNLRAGPGTSHAVVGQLPRGAAVEVLRDNGAGWVRLRPVNGGPEGWIADFLLTRG